MAAQRQNLAKTHYFAKKGLKWLHIPPDQVGISWFDLGKVGAIPNEL
jgi:hypothetical protein